MQLFGYFFEHQYILTFNDHSTRLQSSEKSKSLLLLFGDCVPWKTVAQGATLVWDFLDLDNFFEVLETIGLLMLVVVFLALTSSHINKSKIIRVTETNEIRCAYDLKNSIKL
jgi:hypothetical protein